MKKISLSTVLGGVILFGAGLIVPTVQAADVLSGDTAVSATVAGGDVTLTVDATKDFGSQPMAPVIDFGTQDIGYTVTDYSGNTRGYSITAKLGDDVTERTLSVGGKELSTTAQEVVNEASSSAGDHTGTLPAALQYEGVTTPGALSSTINWELTKATYKMIAE
ncbi:hypothetical protein VNN41_03270 [Lactococcus garvieae]|uniref:hypothetical protein n=1 Tax=Lactococcus garvieae TaxID=1363 RepID=UPI00324BF4E0